jgi:hypothetical protein
VFYAIHDEDGRIIQGNKHFAPTKEYEGQIADLGHKFVKVKSPGILPPDLWMVSTRNGSIVPIHKRPEMRVEVSKTVIKVGDNDAAVLTGAPKDVRCIVRAGSDVIWDIALPAGRLELSIPVPVTYRVSLMKWPYRDYNVDIEARA